MFLGYVCGLSLSIGMIRTIIVWIVAVAGLSSLVVSISTDFGVTAASCLSIRQRGEVRWSRIVARGIGKDLRHGDVVKVRGY